jgi:hypothetical protein
MKIIKIAKQNFHDMDTAYEYQLLTDEQVDKYNKELSAFPSDLKITYYDDDDRVRDEITVADCLDMLKEATYITQEGVLFLTAYVPDVIKKVSDDNMFTGYIEQFNDMV